MAVGFGIESSGNVRTGTQNIGNCNGRKVTVLAFNESVENHFKAIDTISKLCGEAKEDDGRFCTRSGGGHGNFGRSNISNQLEGSQKELNLNLSKYPKLLEKFFNPDISKAYRNVDFDFHIVNQTVANHFYRQGLFDLGDSILNEAEEPEAIAIRSQFFEMHQILEAVRIGNLEPALKWACINREKLK
ncbi:hypothetical protein CMV_023411 [Castanea mollissima]|uniref:CTLH domain-containing protein n=1 Tax=Castanea mollissima TaxID=60419 RepID=A0A8J4QT72_9ROSI|nr:hypothetical protein CMV_023411 [Castanea mollissima]